MENSITGDGDVTENGGKANKKVLQGKSRGGKGKRKVLSMLKRDAKE